jgi:hypothetical protein
MSILSGNQGRETYSKMQCKFVRSGPERGAKMDEIERTFIPRRAAFLSSHLSPSEGVSG